MWRYESGCDVLSASSIFIQELKKIELHISIAEPVLDYKRSGNKKEQRTGSLKCWCCDDLRKQGNTSNSREKQPIHENESSTKTQTNLDTQNGL